MEEKIDLTKDWGTSDTGEVVIKEIKQDFPTTGTPSNVGTAKFAINAAKGHRCVPHRWNVQKEALVRCGLENHWKKKIPLVVRESFAKGIGKGCQNTHFIQFEGQTNNELFIASQFTKPDDATK